MVLSKLFYFHPDHCKRWSDEYFSDGLKPRTRNSSTIRLTVMYLFFGRVVKWWYYDVWKLYNSYWRNFFGWWHSALHIGLRFFLKILYRDAYIYCVYSIVRKETPANLGTLGSLGTRCVASILVDGLSVLHLNWWNTRRYGLFGDWFKIKIRSTWEIRKCPELEMAVGCILPRELMTTRRFKTGEDDASSFCTQGERREELIYSNFHAIL